MRSRPLLLGVALALAWGGAEAASEPFSTLEAEAFYVRWIVPDLATSEVSGVDLRWTVGTRRWWMKTSVAAVHATGPAGVLVIGPTFLGAPGRAEEEPAPAITGTGSGSGGEDGAVQENAPASTATQANGQNRPFLFDDPIVMAKDREEFGIGDIRLQAAVQVGRDLPVGRFYARLGAKAPTADETLGLGTGEWDEWAGFGWFREGWTTDVEAQLEWVHLGDPQDFDFEDGVAAAVYLGWPLGRGGLRMGVESIDAGIPGEPARVRAIAGGYRETQGRVSWNFEASAGLTDSAPDLGVALALRY